MTINAGSIQMPNSFLIEPRREMRGESNGWYACPVAQASYFAVVNQDETVEGFMTLEEAKLAYPSATLSDEEEPQS